MNKRDDFSQKTIDRLCERVGGKCSNPNCRRETKGPHSNPQKRVSIGEAAHITAAADIENKSLRDRLIVEFINARKIYKFFEGLQASDELLLAQIKTQVIMYVSIQEAVVNYLLFELFEETNTVKNLLFQERLVKIGIPGHKLEKIAKELEHDKKDIIPCYNKVQTVDKTKIRYEQKVAALLELNLISEGLADDLVKLYEYRNTVHIEAEMKKKLVYDLSMGELAYRRVEGLSIEVSNALEKLEST